MAHWFTAARSHRVICVVAGLLIINGFDLALTVLAHAQGMLEESNPIAARILPHGAAALTVYKLTLFGIGAGILIRYRRHAASELAALSVLAIYFLLAFQWKVCYDLYAITLTSSADFADLTAARAPLPIF